MIASVLEKGEAGNGRARCKYTVDTREIGTGALVEGENVPESYSRTFIAEGDCSLSVNVRIQEEPNRRVLGSHGASRSRIQRGRRRSGGEGRVRRVIGGIDQLHELAVVWRVDGNGIATIIIVGRSEEANHIDDEDIFFRYIAGEGRRPLDGKEVLGIARHHSGGNGMDGRCKLARSQLTADASSQIGAGRSKEEFENKVGEAVSLIARGNIHVVVNAGYERVPYILMEAI